MARKFGYSKIVILFFVVIAILVINIISNGRISGFVYAIAGVPGQFFHRSVIWTKNYTLGLINVQNLVERTRVLEVENESIHSIRIRVDELERENEELRRQAQIEPILDREIMMSEIILMQRSGLASSIIIDRGALDGVKKSAPVFSSGNTLIGIVEEVFQDSSRVLLTDDPRVRISVRVVGSDVLAQAAGGLDDYTTIELVTNQEEIQEGDELVTSGLDFLPAGFFVGIIDEVTQRESALFQEVRARTLFDPLRSSNVFLYR